MGWSCRSVCPGHAGRCVRVLEERERFQTMGGTLAVPWSEMAPDHGVTRRAARGSEMVPDHGVTRRAARGSEMAPDHGVKWLQTME